MLISRLRSNFVSFVQFCQSCDYFIGNMFNVFHPDQVISKDCGIEKLCSRAGLPLVHFVLNLKKVKKVFSLF